MIFFFTTVRSYELHVYKKSKNDTSSFKIIHWSDWKNLKSQTSWLFLNGSNQEQFTSRFLFVRAIYGFLLKTLQYWFISIDSLQNVVYEMNNLTIWVISSNFNKTVIPECSVYLVYVDVWNCVTKALHFQTIFTLNGIIGIIL